VGRLSYEIGGKAWKNVARIVIGLQNYNITFLLAMDMKILFVALCSQKKKTGLW
jgi:hypothetical protein